MKSLNSINKQLKKLENIIENEVEGGVFFHELFDLGFMVKNSDFATIGEFFDFYNIKFNSEEEFYNIEGKILDNAVLQSTKFSTWREMYLEASSEFIQKKLKNAGF